MKICPICKNVKLKKILDKNKTNIFTGTSNYKKNHLKFKCLLYQCLVCNFIFQNPSNHLKNKLSKIYSSHQAQLSLPIGEGNWGKERFNSMKEKLSELNSNLSFYWFCYGEYEDIYKKELHYKNGEEIFEDSE